MRKHLSRLALILALSAAPLDFGEFSRAAASQIEPAAATQAATSEPANLEPRHTTLLADRPAALELKRAKTGHLLVRTRLNDQDAGSFILDTGAGMNCIDKSLAERLNLPDLGEVEAKGMGGSAAARFRKYDSLALGPVRLDDGKIVELDLKPYGLLMGDTISGIIGNETFQAGVFEIDMSVGTACVKPADGYALDAGATWQPITFKGRRPFVAGKIEGHDEGLFLLDCGANGALVVHAPTVKKFDLLKDRTTKLALSGGVGGIKATPAGTVSAFILAAQQLSEVSAVFSKATDGLTSDDSTQGTVGMDVLKQFRLIVDYPHERVALIPHSTPSTRPTAP